MKSLEELNAIREQMKKHMELRDNENGHTRVVVAMGTCGIAAGARETLAAFLDEVNGRGLPHITVSQSCCVGECRLEPIVEVYVPGQEKVTYAKVKPEMVPTIVEQHLVNHSIVTEYTIGAAE